MNCCICLKQTDSRSDGRCTNCEVITPYISDGDTSHKNQMAKIVGRLYKLQESNIKLRGLLLRMNRNWSNKDIDAMVEELV